jgi:hypothetical protein
VSLPVSLCVLTYKVLYVPSPCFLVQSIACGVWFKLCRAAGVHIWLYCLVCAADRGNWKRSTSQICRDCRQLETAAGGLSESPVQPVASI